MLWPTEEEIQLLNTNIKFLFEQYGKQLNNDEDTDQTLATFIDKTSEETFSSESEIVLIISEQAEKFKSLFPTDQIIAKSFTYVFEVKKKGLLDGQYAREGHLFSYVSDFIELLADANVRTLAKVVTASPYANHLEKLIYDLIYHIRKAELRNDSLSLTTPTSEDTKDKTNSSNISEYSFWMDVHEGEADPEWTSESAYYSEHFPEHTYGYYRYTVEHSFNDLKFYLDLILNSPYIEKSAKQKLMFEVISTLKDFYETDQIGILESLHERIN